MGQNSTFFRETLEKLPSKGLQNCPRALERSSRPEGHAKALNDSLSNQGLNHRCLSNTQKSSRGGKRRLPSDVSHVEMDAMNRSFMSELPPRPKRHKNSKKTDDEAQKSRLKKSFSVGLPEPPRPKRQKNGSKAAHMLKLKKCDQCKKYTLDLARHSEDCEGQQKTTKATTKTATANEEEKCDQCGIFTLDLTRHVEEHHKTSNDDDEIEEGDHDAMNRSFMSEAPLRPKRHKNSNKTVEVQKSRLKKSFSVAHLSISSLHKEMLKKQKKNDRVDSFKSPDPPTVLRVADTFKVPEDPSALEAMNGSFMSEAPLRPKRHKKSNKADDEVQKSRLQKSFSVGLPEPQRPKRQSTLPSSFPESYECFRCEASGSYATVAEHIQG